MYVFLHMRHSPCTWQLAEFLSRQRRDVVCKARITMQTHGSYFTASMWMMHQHMLRLCICSLWCSYRGGCYIHILPSVCSVGPIFRTIVIVLEAKQTSVRQIMQLHYVHLILGPCKDIVLTCFRVRKGHRVQEQSTCVLLINQSLTGKRVKSSVLVSKCDVSQHYAVKKSLREFRHL